MWWLNSTHFPQVATFYVEVPAPDPFKDLSEIRLEFVEFLRHRFAVHNLSPHAGIVNTYNVEDKFTISVRGVSGRLLTDKIDLFSQSVGLNSQGYEESSEVLMVRTASNSISNEDVLNTVEKFSDPITLILHFNSNYDIEWSPHSLWFFHKLFLFSGVYGEVTYVYK